MNLHFGSTANLMDASSNSKLQSHSSVSHEWHRHFIKIISGKLSLSIALYFPINNWHNHILYEFLLQKTTIYLPAPIELD